MAGISTAIEIQDRVSGTLNRITASLYNTTAAFYDVDSASETTFNTSGVQAMTQELYAYEDRIQQIESELVSANRKLQQMEEETEDVRQKASQLENAFGQLGSIVAGLGLGMLMKEQVSEAVDYASDLTEVQNVVDTVFGDNSVINSWAENMLNAVGLNELSAKQFAGTMGAMLSSSGVAQNQVEDMSMSMTELAGNMASFYNLDAEEAFTKIRSGISGETEPLKQLGINMSVANMEAYALSQGIETAYSKMSQAEQVTLRYNYLLASTANAQGDFTRTSGSFANQVKLLEENWTQFTGKLATGVLPVLAYGANLLNSFIGFVSKNWDVIGSIIAGLAGAVGVITAVALAIKVAAVATSIWNAVMAMNPIVLVISAVVALIGVIVGLCNWIANLTGITQSGLGIIVGAFAVAGAGILNSIIGLVNFIIGIGVELYNLIAVFANFFANVFNDPVGAIINLFSGMFDVIAGIVESAAAMIDTVLGTDMAGAVAGFRNMVSDGVADIIGEQTVVMEKLNASDYMADGIDYGDAFGAGASLGDGIADKLSGFTASLDTSNIDSAYTSTDVGSVADSLSGIKSDTSDISNSVDISNENLKYLRDIAERDVINRFTTAEIKVDMQNNNTISSDMDIDGIVKILTEGVQEAMVYAAEGVHA